MSIGRRIAVLFLAVNAVVLGFLLWAVEEQSAKIRDRFDRDVLDRAALDLGRSFRLTTERVLQHIFAETQASPITAAIAIGELDYWDDDFVRQYLDRAVLVNVTPFDTVLYNPRPRFLWKNDGDDALDRAEIRGRLDAAVGVERFRDSQGRQVVYGTFAGRWQDGKWAFLFRLRPSDLASYDPLSPIRGVLWILLPGTIALLVLLWFVLSRWIFQPIAEMERAALRLSAGDYDVPLEYGHRRDEFGSVARAFNAMMRDLRQYRSHMEGLVAEATERFRVAEWHLVVAERLAAMGRIAAGIAHEINNPLGGILNALEKLARTDLPEDRRRKYAGIAEEGINRIRGIVSRVLATTPRHSTVGPVALDEVIEQGQGLVGHKLREKSIDFRRTGETGLYVTGDRNELAQVFLNLMINACDAMAEGGILGVDCRSQGDRAVIAVADTGVGIPPEIQGRIFDLFFTTKAGNEGTGLGLGIVHNIITGHGGTVAVESEPGKGSVFTIKLPLAQTPGGSPT